jgi:SPP1 family predicted phage head-tail adaptor
VGQLHVRAGQLRHQIQIYAPVDAIDSFGDDELQYQLMATVWGSIEPLSGRDLWYANQIRADATNKITLRYTSQISSAHRLVWNGRVYEPGPQLSTQERGYELTVLCTEIRYGALGTTTAAP